MAQSEAYEALSKGMVKGNLAPVEVLKGWKHAEVTKYLTKTPFLYNTLFFLTMNLEKWNSLPSHIQRAIEDVNERCFYEIAAGLWDKQNEDALNWAVNEMGMEIIELSEEEMLMWIRRVEPIHKEYTKKLNKRGLNGREILDTVKQLAEKYNKGMADGGR
jgi:TRAP-type C4-dicarboxylate transport system substrate-binding protein